MADINKQEEEPASNLEVTDLREQKAGVKVYERPARASLPVWLFVLVAIIALAALWLAFRYVF